MADKQKAAAAARLRKSAAAATEQLDEAGASKAALRFAEAAASAAASGVTLEGVNGFFEPGFLPVLHAIDAPQRHAEVDEPQEPRDHALHEQDEAKVRGGRREQRQLQGLDVDDLGQEVGRGSGLHIVRVEVEDCCE